MKVRVTFELWIPADAIQSEIKEWLKFRLHKGGKLALSNPLTNHQLDATNGTIKFERIG